MTLADGTVRPMTTLTSTTTEGIASKKPGPVAAAAALDCTAAGVMVLLCLAWSLQQISLKAIASHASPMLMVALRSLIAMLLLVALMHRRGERPSRRHWRPGALAGALFALEFLLVTEALRLTHASHVVVFLYTAPIFAALGLHVRLPAERLGIVQWAGIVLAFTGIVLAFLGSAGSPAGDAASLALLGDALALMAGAAWGATTIAIRCSALATAPATETLLYQLLAAFLILLPAAGLTGQWHFESTWRVWSHLAFQSLVVSFASFLTWFWLLRCYLASQLGVFSFLTPLLGVVLGAWLLGESLEPRFIAASVLVLAGIGLVNGYALVARRVRPMRSPIFRIH